MNISSKRRPMSAKNVTFDARNLYVELQNGTQLSAALTSFPRLLNGSIAERNEWEVIGAGDGIHWPLLDEDISVAGLRRDQVKAGLGVPAIQKIFEIVGEIYNKSDQLSSLTIGRRFTLDGVFVSTTGHVVAEYIYGLRQGSPYPLTSDGERVQVMLIGASSKKFSFSSTAIVHQTHGAFLLCLRKGPDGFEEIYNGPFPKELLAAKIPASKGRQVTLSTGVLLEENPAVLGKEHSFASINHLFKPKLSHAA